MQFILLSILLLTDKDHPHVLLLQGHEIIVNCKVFEMNGKMKACIQFKYKEEATEALVCKHANSLSGFVVRITIKIF